MGEASLPEACGAHRETLGVDSDAAPADIHAAYVALRERWDPTRHPLQHRPALMAALARAHYAYEAFNALPGSERPRAQVAPGAQPGRAAISGGDVAPESQATPAPDSANTTNVLQDAPPDRSPADQAEHGSFDPDRLFVLRVDAATARAILDAEALEPHELLGIGPDATQEEVLGALALALDRWNPTANVGVNFVLCTHMLWVVQRAADAALMRGVHAVRR